MKIRRWIATVSFSSLIGLYVMLSMPKRISFISLALFIVFTVFHWKTKNKYTGYLLLSLISILVSSVFTRGYSSFINNKILKYNDIENTLMTGYVQDISVTSSGSVCYTIKADTINNEKISNFRVFLYSGYDLDYNDTVVLSGKYKTFTQKSNYKYYYSKGVYGYFYADSIKTEHENTLTGNPFYKIKNLLKDSLTEIYDGNILSVALSMGIGDRTQIDNNTKESFSYSGISHALVVSGLHIGFISYLFSLAVYTLPISKKIKNIILAVLIFVFMGIIGFTPSIIRAGILAIAMLIGKNLIAETDNYTILAIIVLITLVINPYSAVNLSLLLSYSAYFGVITAISVADSKNYTRIKKSLLITLFAVMFSSPFMSLAGMSTSLLSPIFNLIFSPIILIICGFSFFTGIFNIIPLIRYVSLYSLVPANKILITILLKATELIQSNFSFALVNLADTVIKIIIFSVLISVIIAFIQIDDGRFRMVFIAGVTIISLLCYNFTEIKTVKIIAFDSGSETSFFIQDNKETVLILTENIKESTFSKAKSNLLIGNIDYVIYCSEKDDYPDALKDSDIKTINTTDSITNNSFTVNSVINNKKMYYIIDICGVTISFSHNKTDLSSVNTDFYFFGADTPSRISTDNAFYFYPLRKAHTDLAESVNASVLYGPVTIKIDKKSGNYTIVEDVKNFGSQL